MIFENTLSLKFLSYFIQFLLIILIPSDKVIRMTPEVEAHLAFLRGLEKRSDIKVNTD